MKKKWIALLLGLMLLCTASFFGSTFAMGEFGESNKGHDHSADGVDQEFISSSLSGICYSCGQPYMNLVTYKISETNTVSKACPTMVGAKKSSQDPPKTDIGVKNEHWSYERCGYCGYESNHWLSFYSYEGWCYNRDEPSGGNPWEAVTNYNPALHNRHQNAYYWFPNG